MCIAIILFSVFVPDISRSSKSADAEILVRFEPGFEIVLKIQSCFVHDFSCILFSNRARKVHDFFRAK